MKVKRDLPKSSVIRYKKVIIGGADRTEEDERRI